VRDEGEGGITIGAKSIDNSQVVRERDPRASRDLVWLLCLVAVLVGGVVLYAWPHFEIRQTGIQTEQMQRERERLLEENRKLRLEKASLESLARVEAIAARHLDLEQPGPQQIYVIEAPEPAPPGARLASVDAGDARP
jgi:cell division protein FtsL